MSYLYLFLSLSFLFLSKKWLTAELSRLIHRFGGSRHSMIVVWSVIFLPGTVIHELSHFFFAILTGARTGKVEILPEYLEDNWESENEGGNVALGYVQTQKLNIIQGFFVGTAPLIVGTILLIWIASLIQSAYLSGEYFALFLQGYLFFTIANSFFPSWSDIKQTLPLIISILLLGVFLWIVGVSFVFKPGREYLTLLDALSFTIGISFAINLVILGLFRLVNLVVRK